MIVCFRLGAFDLQLNEILFLWKKVNFSTFALSSSPVDLCKAWESTSIYNMDLYS